MEREREREDELAILMQKSMRNYIKQAES